MYICLEGLKGCGKSTLLRAAHQLLAARQVPFGTVAPTQAVPASQSWPERLSARWPALRRCDAWNEYLYAQRAHYAAATAEWQHPLVLGDRSLVTSYATRWRKWGHPQRCIARVDQLEAQVPAPQHVILLEVAPEVAWARTQARHRTYGQHDETLERLREVHEAYYQVATYGIPRLAGTQWHVLNAQQPAPLVLRDWLALVHQLVAPIFTSFPLSLTHVL
jgi:thymidylate kinase